MTLPINDNRLEYNLSKMKKISREFSLDKLLRPNIREIEPYIPIEPADILGARLGFKQEQIIKLDGNENPYGCSPAVRNALASYRYYHSYPDPEHRLLRQALQQYTGIPERHIICGAGSDELIDLILRLTLNPGDKVINCPPTFGMYTFCTEVCGGRVMEAQRSADFDIDVDKISKLVDENTKVIFIASPNNPSGNILSREKLSKLLEMNILVALDEAYCEFSGQTNADLVLKAPNLIVLRTFSKWAGLAGLRVGYGIFPEEFVSLIMKIKQPYNVNIAAQIAALESLKDIEHLRKTAQMIISERGNLYRMLQDIKYLSPFPSQANFILCRVSGIEAKDVWQKLQRYGIFIRYYNTRLLRNYIRISTGRPEDHKILIKALKEIGG